MKRLLRAVGAGSLAALMLAGAETVVAYPHPSFGASAFLRWSSLTYWPLMIALALGLSVAFDRRGLDLWLPVVVGLMRVADGMSADASQHAGTVAAIVIAAVAVLLLARWSANAQPGSPPFLFALTVGVVLPLLAARIAMTMPSSSGPPRDRMMALGALAGLVCVLFLRSVVVRWPKVGPIFVLGPIVTLIIWSRQSPTPGVIRAASASTADRRPDIVLIVLDTVRAHSLSAYGSERDTMPNLEAFAKSGVTYTRAWTNGSWTLPAHASLFSGMSTGKHRFDSGFAVADRKATATFLAPRLHEAGYATAAVAANFGVFGREEPLLRGFDRIAAEPLRPFAFKPWFFNLLRWFPDAAWLRPQSSVFPGPSMRAAWVVEKARQFWSETQGKPRFLFVNFMEAHLPWIPEPEDRGAFGPRGLESEASQLQVLGRYLTGGRATPEETALLKSRYEESLRSLDHHLGKLLADVGASENTIVVITSDHGESLGENDRFGHRNSLDEPATRIPLFIRGPKQQDGPKSEALVQLTDVYGYLAAASGLPLESGLDAQVIGERRQVVIEHRPGPQGALPSSYPRGDLSALVEWPYKYIEGPNVQAGLFNLETDPFERSNLVASDPGRASVLREALRRLAGPASRDATGPERDDERLRALGYLR